MPDGVPPGTDHRIRVLRKPPWNPPPVGPLPTEQDCPARSPIRENSARRVMLPPKSHDPGYDTMIWVSGIGRIAEVPSPGQPTSGIFARIFQRVASEPTITRPSFPGL